MAAGKDRHTSHLCHGRAFDASRIACPAFKVVRGSVTQSGARHSRATRQASLRGRLASRKAQRKGIASKGKAPYCTAGMRRALKRGQRLEKGAVRVARLSEKNSAEEQSNELHSKATRHASIGCMASRFDSDEVKGVALRRSAGHGTARHLNARHSTASNSGEM